MYELGVVYRNIQRAPAEAADGQAALDLHRSMRPDLVLLDVQLPRLDGWSVLTQLRQREIGWRRAVLPALGLTLFAVISLGADLSATRFMGLALFCARRLSAVAARRCICPSWASRRA